MIFPPKHQPPTIIIIFIIIVAVIIPTVGIASAQDDADAILKDGNTYWQGQKLARSDGVNPDETLEIRTSDGKLVQQVAANDEGRVVFGTKTLKGDYFLEDSDNNKIASFEIAVQTLNISLSSDSVTNSGTNTETTFQIDSNRGRFDVLISASGLSESELLNIFKGSTEGSQSDDGKILLKNITGDGEITGDFEGIDAGSYEFTITAADTTASDMATVTVNTAQGVTANFATSTITEHRGDVVTFTITLKNTDTATVTIGSTDVNYKVNLEVTDGNGDGEITILMDTFRAGGWNGDDASAVYSTAESADDLSATRTTEATPSPLAAGDYSLSIAVSGNEKDVGSLTLTSRSTNSIAVNTAPREASLTSVTAITDTITSDSTIAKNGWLVLEIQASGIYAYLTSVDDLGTNGVSVSITQTNEGPNQEPVTIDPSSGTLISEPSKDRFFLVIPMTADRIKAGQEYQTTFEIDGDKNPYVASGETESVSAPFEITDATATINRNADEKLILPPKEEVTVSGTTTLAAGSTLTVRIRSTSADHPFLKREPVKVNSQGEWAVGFNLSGVPVGTSFTVSVASSGKTLTSVDGEVGEPEAMTETEPGRKTVIKTTVKTVERTVIKTRVETRTVVKTRIETRTVIKTRAEPETVVITKTVLRTPETTPGLGVGTALVALLVASLLAIRRQQ